MTGNKTAGFSDRKSTSGKIGIAAAAALLLAAGVIFSMQLNVPTEAMDYPVRSFSNMCAYEGKVYAGVNGTYGEPITQKTSIFTIWEDKVYYVDKVQEAYDSMTDELLSIKRSDMDGSHEEVLAEDVFLPGAGHEKLIGDKLFYGYAYDENYRMKYACVDINTGERKEIATDRMDTIVGYDGTYLYYQGYDTKKEENILGRIRLKNNKDEILAVYAEVDEEGYIENTVFSDGKLYCLTLVEKPEGYDYRTYKYRMQVRNGSTGKVESELSIDFTGASNYSYLIEDGEIYASVEGKIIAMPLEGTKIRTIADMKKEEYWGILHFLPGDGYLYYETIADINEETGNNDYFYRVPAEGGAPELLKEWFMI